MKNNLFLKSLLLLTVGILFALYDQHTAFASSYHDPSSAVSFDIPDGWMEIPLNQDRDFIKVKYVPIEETGEVIMFGYLDAWDSLSALEKQQYDRSEYNNSALSHEDIAELFGTFTTAVSEVTEVTYNNIIYFKVPTTQTVTINGSTISANMINLLYVSNGMVYEFLYGYPGSKNPHYHDFETLLLSVKYPVLENTVPSATNTDNPSVDQSSSAENNQLYDSSADRRAAYFAGTVIFSLFVTITVYSLPIMIYRFAIRKRPVKRRKAIIITILYAIAALICMVFIMLAVDGGGTPGRAVVLWSYVNYLMLTKGRDRTIPSGMASPGEPDPPEKHNNVTSTPARERFAASMQRYSSMKEYNNLQSNTSDAVRAKQVPICIYCGAHMTANDDYCIHCGKKVIH